MAGDGSSGFFSNSHSFPLVYLRLRGRFEGRHAQELRQIMASVVARGERFLVVTDTRAVQYADAVARKELSDYAKEFVPHREALVVESVVIIESGIARLLYQGVAWMMPDITQGVTVANVTEAAALLEERWRAEVGEPCEALRAGLELLREDRIRAAS